MNLYKQTECPKRIAVAVLSFFSHSVSWPLQTLLPTPPLSPSECQTWELHDRNWRAKLGNSAPLTQNGSPILWSSPSLKPSNPLGYALLSPPTPPSVCLLTFTHCVAFTHKQLLYLLCRFEWWSLNPYLVFPLPLAFCFAPKCGRTIKLMDISLEVYTDQVRDSRSCWLYNFIRYI